MQRHVVSFFMAAVVALSMVYFGPGHRIGEAAMPGPRLDDSQVSDFWDDAEAMGDPWMAGPPSADLLTDDDGAAVAVSVVPLFAAARKFLGARPGAVFKLGHEGLGYYRDVAPVVEIFPSLCPAHGVPRVVLRLDELIDVNPKPKDAGPLGVRGGASSRRCRRARRRGRRGTETCQATLGQFPAAVPQTPDDSELQADEESSEAGHDSHEGDVACPDNETVCAGDRSHIGAGLWAIDTVNPNAWPGTLEYLRMSAADFIVTQEARVSSGQPCDEAESQARGAKWSLSVKPCRVTEADANSAGVSVGARCHIGVAAPISAAAAGDSQFLAGRFHVRRIGAVCRGGFSLGSVYLHDSVGVHAKCNLDLLQEVAAELALLAGGWIIGGDWNCTPEELVATGWLELIDGVIHAPRMPTCNGHIYDYFVVKRSFQHAVFRVVAIGDALCKPHSPARMLLRSAPRCIMVRGLSRPRGFRAYLPYGPEVKPLPCEGNLEVQNASPSAAEIDVDTEYARLIAIIESSLSVIAGHDQGEAMAHAGRARGPRFRWRNACGDQLATRSRRTTPVSRAWRRVANWLHTIRRAGPVSFEAAAARRQILRYNHELPADADAAQFEAWLGLLTAQMLKSKIWVESLSQVASSAAERAETAAARAARLTWTSWLVDGPARGLRRQHRMSRTAIGWIADRVSAPEEVRLSEADCIDELDETQLESLLQSPHGEPVPLNAQQVADREASVWATEWGVGAELPMVEWPTDLGPPPPLFELQRFRKALSTFPAATGLGWDDLHPRALLRLSDSLLLALLTLLAACEHQGRWPQAVAIVIIALLPKPDGGRRPIGLFPWLPRVWMRVRRQVARDWELANSRAYLYAGVGKGANVAAWKQGARAELTACLPHAQYGQALLDLVKAFERVPHHVLVREAAKLGYSLWILRLALAAYRLGRVVRVDGVLSSMVYAARGITAGSGLATTEMRILLINIVDSACKLYPAVTPTLFVDDLSAEVAGTFAFVMKQLVPFVLCVCDSMTKDLLEVSKAKSVCTASDEKLGRALERGLCRFGIRFVRRVKSLGTGLGAGTRRNAMAGAARLRAFRKRLPRFRRLRAAGVSTARLLRTGGTAAMTYGQSVMGVAPSVLLGQRRAAAAAASPATGVCGQSLDVALLMADETSTGKADPAFAAHTGPIGEWAQAIWERWLPLTALHRLVSSAKQRLGAARRPWNIVYGPGAAFVATAARLKWVVDNATDVTTDDGRLLRLHVDPPVVVAREVEAAVRRWRWRNVERDIPSLDSGGAGRGANIAPVMSLLKPAPDNPSWTAAFRAGLKSALLNRQWPQSRCFAAGLANHNRCCLCLAAVMAEHGAECPDDLPENVLASVPVGSAIHRVWACPAHRDERALYAPAVIREREPAQYELAAYTRALFPSIEHEVPLPASESTFAWVVRPSGGTVRARFYTDGSRLDGPSSLLARNGWGFVAVNADGEVVAEARGLPPSWIHDIPGTEAWAILQAAMVAELGSDYRVDCAPCVEAIHAGKEWATSSRRPLARVFGLVFTAIDDTPRDAFVRMPAHSNLDEVGRLRLGNGELLSDVDHRANSLADVAAKAAVEEHRVPLDIRRRVKKEAQRVRAAAMWLGRVTHLANSQPDAPHRDSEGTRRRPKARGLVPRRGSVAREQRPAALGGHVIFHQRNSWLCVVCWRSSANWSRFASQRCEGSVAARDSWGHRLMLSGDLHWCSLCGAFAQHKAKGLAKPCPGPPRRWQRGGRALQLRALQQQRHPRTGEQLPCACLAPLCASLEVVGSAGRQPARSCCPVPAPSRLEALRERIVAKEKAAREVAKVV